MAISTRIYNDQALSMLNRITGDIQNIQSRIATGKDVLKASGWLRGSSPSRVTSSFPIHEFNP